MVWKGWIWRWAGMVIRNGTIYRVDFSPGKGSEPRGRRPGTLEVVWAWEKKCYFTCWYYFFRWLLVAEYLTCLVLSAYRAFRLPNPDGKGIDEEEYKSEIWKLNNCLLFWKYYLHDSVFSAIKKIFCASCDFLRLPRPSMPRWWKTSFCQSFQRINTLQSVNPFGNFIPPGLKWVQFVIFKNKNFGINDSDVKSLFAALCFTFAQKSCFSAFVLILLFHMIIEYNTKKVGQPCFWKTFRLFFY